MPITHWVKCCVHKFTVPVASIAVLDDVKSRREQKLQPLHDVNDLKLEPVTDNNVYLHTIKKFSSLFATLNISDLRYC